MPVGGRAEDSEEEQVFQSPEWEPAPGAKDSVGASPQLRRSARKRKSTAGDDSLVTKKKRQSPTKMPKVTRSPKGQTSQDQAQAQGQGQAQAFEAMLMAMEGRITAKIEKASEASREAAHQAKLNSEGLELLESRVDANEGCLMDALRESETRIMETVTTKIQELVQEHVKEMVGAELHAAGFDRDLTAADMSTRNSAPGHTTLTNNSSQALSRTGTYARVTGQPTELGPPLRRRTNKKPIFCWRDGRSGCGRSQAVRRRALRISSRISSGWKEPS